ncbi:hypothetical protein AGDE_11403 [Angomonas deanei]|nr:hypothetical protein AGDE_11403 [Angomonas deanei]|eukprot:EPY26359.1 hypothetical protein AGDE_11403 [Angomonas deanei]
MSQLIEKRLDLVGSSAGSVISVATWCSLHAPQSAAILTSICTRLASPKTEDATRAALLYVVHEMLLNGAAKGTPEAAKRAVVQAVGQQLPSAIEKVAALDSTTTPRASFNVALAKVLAWWRMLALFSESWYAKVKASLDQLERQEGDMLSGEHSLPSALDRVQDSLKRYRDAKRQYDAVLEKEKDKADNPMCLGRIEHLIKVAHGAFEGSEAIALWGEREKARLTGAPLPESTHTPSGEPPSKKIKRELSPAPVEEDILGSFYD